METDRQYVNRLGNMLTIISTETHTDRQYVNRLGNISTIIRTGTHTDRQNVNRLYLVNFVAVIKLSVEKAFLELH